MNQADLLIELGCEELPPKSLKRLQQDFTQGIIARLAEAKLAHGIVNSYASPRRLALVIQEVALTQPDSPFERRGPSVKAAFDQAGKPTKAALGFAASQGVKVSDLSRVSTPKGEWLCYQGIEAGRASQALIVPLLQSCLNELPIAKRMRWGARRDEFVRPLSWLVVMLGDELIPAEIFGIKSDRYTQGHRFHAPRPLCITQPSDYEALLQDEGKVVANFAKRRATIAHQAKQLAQQQGLTVLLNDELLDEVTALVEWPVAMLGSFDEAFLAVPAEALMASMQAHQKYFPTQTNDGTLANRFIFIANLASKNPEQVISGNEKVIRPRLADAAFFWQSDLQTPLHERVHALKAVTFQQELGTLHDKTLRLQNLSALLAEQLGEHIEQAKRAALLAKADLTTDMVFEFDHMQGIAGYHYALHSGEPQAVAEAIRDQYKPAGAGDYLPSNRLGLILALSDRLDNLAGLFGIGQHPSGTKDPFALRRAAIGVLRMLIEAELELDLSTLLQQAIAQHPNLSKPNDTLTASLTYCLDRLASIYQDANIGMDALQAVKALGLTKPLDIDRRVRAVSAFSTTPEASILAEANKRVAKLLAKAPAMDGYEVQESLFTEGAETQLWTAMMEVKAALEPQLMNKAYQNALSILASLHHPIQEYFDQVMVMAEEASIRQNRLAMLAQLRQLFLQVADVSLLQP